MKPITRSCLHYSGGGCFFLSHPNNKGLKCNRKCRFYSDFFAYCKQSEKVGARDRRGVVSRHHGAMCLIDTDSR